MAELRKCPFCGGEAEIWEDKVFGTFVPQCKECTAQHGRYTSRERAVEAWNTRKPMESKVAELEKLKGEYEHHCIHGAWQRGAIDGAKTALSKAISIVRGKE